MDLKSQLNPSDLEKLGAAIKVQIKNGNKIKDGWAKIDTGSNRTIIEEKLIKELELPASNIPFLRRAAPTVTERIVDSYNVVFLFPNLNVEWPNLVSAKSMEYEVFENEPIVAMLGRDFLSQVKFTYNGRTGEYEIIL